MRLRELLQEEVKKVNPTFYFEFDIGRSVSNDEFKNIQIKIEKLPHCNFVTSQDNEIYGKFEIISQSDSSNKVLGNLFGRIEGIILDQILLNTEANNTVLYQGGECRVIIKGGVPAFQISAHDIMIEGCREFEMKGIDKLIIDSQNLVITACQAIPPGGVLSILKLQNVRKVKLTSPRDGWWNIVQQHLDRDRDIMDCQEELIQAGYKDYARL